MKVAPLESNYDNTATEKPSFAARLLVVLIKLNFVPVKLDKTGKAAFRLLSFRCFLSFACWALPFICFISVFIYESMLVFWIEFGIPAGLTIVYVTGLSILSSLMLMATFLPFCLGYLVGNVDLLIPIEIAQTNFLKLILIWTMAVSNLFLPEILGAEASGILFGNKISSSLLILWHIIGIGVLKMLANSFKRKCEQLKYLGSFYSTATRILDLYKSIKKGAGPIFFLLYSYDTLTIIVMLYQIIAGLSSVTETFMALSGICLMLYELSAYGQELNENICSSAALVRYF